MLRMVLRKIKNNVIENCCHLSSFLCSLESNYVLKAMVNYMVCKIDRISKIINCLCTKK